MSKVVSANKLASGTVVFLGSDGWVDAIGEAMVFADEAAAELGLASARLDERRAVIVDPFIVERYDQAVGRASLTLRDAIRAFGPTIDYRPATRSEPR
jgi:hypothetical protein